MKTINHSENGMVLIVVLVMLVIITGIAGTSLYNAGIHEKIASGQQLNSQLFYASDNLLQRMYKKFNEKNRDSSLAAVTLADNDANTSGIVAFASAELDDRFNDGRSSAPAGFELSVGDDGINALHYILRSESWQDLDRSSTGESPTDTIPGSSEINSVHSQHVMVLVP